MKESFSYQGILLDIEGTTTPVQFVYDVLFPYARRAMQSYLQAHWEAADFEPLRGQILENIAAINASPAGEGAPHVDAASQAGPALLSAVVEHLKWQMSEDQKNPPLKALQGRIWRAGYESGELKAPVFDDAALTLEVMKSLGVPAYIYSSGSVEAQILLFKYSDHGDLSAYLSGYFDTHTGPKKVAASYEKICAEVGILPGQMLFVSDNIEEVKAAAQAGLQVALAKRPGNAPIEEAHPFKVVENFAHLPLPYDPQESENP